MHPKQHRIFYPGDLKVPHIVSLDAATSHHLLRVLRVEKGESVILFNGNGREFVGTIIDARKLAHIQLLTDHACSTESSLWIELGQALSRHEKMDYAIQKAVELGVNRIVPLFTERTKIKLSDSRQESRLAHWREIMIHACEQSGRCKIPEIVSPLPLAQWLTQSRDGLAFICYPSAPSSLSNISTPQRVTLLIGPEGGFSESEIKLATASHFMGLSLGPRILRTETATIVALSLVQRVWGDLN